MQASEQERALREFTCALCKGVLRDPLSTPCGHHFCKPCLEERFEVGARFHTSLLLLTWAGLIMP